MIFLHVQFSRGHQGTEFKVLFFDYCQSCQRWQPGLAMSDQSFPRAVIGQLPSISSQC